MRAVSTNASTALAFVLDHAQHRSTRALLSLHSEPSRQAPHEPAPRRHRRRPRRQHRRPPARRPGPPVRLLTRSGSGPEHPLIERRQVDVSQPDASPSLRRRRGRLPLHPRLDVRRQGLARRAARRRAGGPRRRRPGRGGRGLPREPLLLRPGRRSDDRGPAAHRHDAASSACAPSCSAASASVRDADGQRRRVRLLRAAGADRTRRRADGADGARRQDDARGGQPRPAALLHLRARPRRPR